MQMAASVEQFGLMANRDKWLLMLSCKRNVVISIPLFYCYQEFSGHALQLIMLLLLLLLLLVLLMMLLI